MARWDLFAAWRGSSVRRGTVGVVLVSVGLLSSPRLEARDRPTVLRAEIQYDLRDTTGVGWTFADGTVYVTITVSRGGATMVVRGRRQWRYAMITVPGDSRSGHDSVFTAGNEERYVGTTAQHGAVTTLEFAATPRPFTLECAHAVRGLPVQGSAWECTAQRGYRFAGELSWLSQPVVLTTARRGIRNVLRGSTSGHDDRRQLEPARTPWD